MYSASNHARLAALALANIMPSRTLEGIARDTKDSFVNSGQAQHRAAAWEWGGGGALHSPADTSSLSRVKCPFPMYGFCLWLLCAQRLQLS